MAQAGMVVVPPARRVPEGPLMVMGVLVRAMFSRTREPAVAGLEVVVQAVRMATGTLVKELSRRVTEPVSILEEPPAEMSMPTWQLLMDRPW